MIIKKLNLNLIHDFTDLFDIKYSATIQFLVIWWRIEWSADLKESLHSKQIRHLSLKPEIFSSVKLRHFVLKTKANGSNFKMFSVIISWINIFSLDWSCWSLNWFTLGVWGFSDERIRTLWELILRTGPDQIRAEVSSVQIWILSCNPADFLRQSEDVHGRTGSFEWLF